MSKFPVPVIVSLNARAVVEVEADSLIEACELLQAEIDEQGFLSRAGEAEFEADWGNMSELKLDDVTLPDGTLFPTSSR